MLFKVIVCLCLFQGVSVPLQAKNSNQRWVSGLVL